MALKVNEIFYSIQGESSFAGQRCIFIRLTGCNLRCSYCDTTYAYTEGSDMTIEQILEEVKKFDCQLVEVTGGEPLEQNDTPVLIDTLLEEGFEVLLETNGSYDIGIISERCRKIVDIKCPSSAEASRNNLDNLSKLHEYDEVKFVIGSREDFDFAKEVLGSLPTNFLKEHIVHFSPVFEQIKPNVLSAWILEEKLDVRMQLQLHKYIWDPSQRGV